MKRAIITPTYKGHFCFIKNYLKSFDKYLQDRNFPIYFIISKSEQNEFNLIIAPYIKNLNINICFLEDILKKFKIQESPEILLKKYGRLSFQTIKKLYGALYIKADEFLLLDSESECIKPTNMNKLFDEYFKKPSIVASKVSDYSTSYQENFTYNYIKTIANVLGNSPTYWLVESYNWFYELRILKDLIADYGSIIDIIKDVKLGKFHDLEGVLECLLYYQYIINNNQKYKYNIVIFSDEIKKCNPEYIVDFTRSPVKYGGMFELFSLFLNENNFSFFQNFIERNNLQYVLRFENSSFTNNVLIQDKLINRIKPNILASSQNHCWGINGTFSKKMDLICPKKQKLKKHIMQFFGPILKILKWFCEPLSILKYLLIYIKDVLKNIHFLLENKL